MQEYDELDEDLTVPSDFLFLLGFELEFLVFHFAGFFLYLLLFFLQFFHIFQQNLLYPVMLDTLVFHLFVVLVKALEDVHYEVGQTLNFHIVLFLKTVNHFMQFNAFLFQIPFLNLLKSNLSGLLCLHLLKTRLFFNEQFDEFFKLIEERLVNLHVTVTLYLSYGPNTIIHLILIPLFLLIFLVLQVTALQILIIFPYSGLELLQIAKGFLLVLN